MNMVERVARAIMNAYGADFFEDGSIPLSSIEAARAAIEAMREPDSYLLWQAVEAVHKFAHSHSVEFNRYHGVLATYTHRVYSERFAVGFNAVIDAALNESQEGE